MQFKNLCLAFYYRCNDFYSRMLLSLYLCYYLDPQIVELPDHPYFVGVQFHPEFKSRPGKPSALFLGIFLSHGIFTKNVSP